ncbi:RNA-binding protein YlmH, contains S4-like domain [Caloramator fervidus]|uniref:RNA-binding protein YlmH, contains S4-like domain n=1 Tax=Caloramator fervidus TaxID=29344 RepID=A0A1H5U2W7_9CLOT|nr:YlmH/Sll1252 family protein [Caloramator fervidus]SEF68617.1 RNA-binding protein YlmH, contains S4-like domain [Caloramator fervidus]
MECIKFKEYILNKNTYLSFLNKIALAKKWICTFTDFLDPEEQSALREMCFDEDVEVSFFKEGILERTVARLGTCDDEYPIDIIKVEGNFKFEKLEHRDYLGAILSLGIKREKVGDINVFDDGAEIYIMKDLSDYIMLNLHKIKHTSVKLRKINLNEARERQIKYKEFILNVPSFRIDAIVSELIGVSRSKASDIIKSEKVKLDFKIIKELDTKVKPNSIISVKGYGRFIIGEHLGVTKSGRFVIEAKKIV